jgi:hypothetical protein
MNPSIMDKGGTSSKSYGFIWVLTASGYSHELNGNDSLKFNGDIVAQALSLEFILRQAH